MSKKLDFRLEKVARPPEGVAWLWHTVDLLTSPAWRARSDQLARLLDLLEVEHLKNGGAENGHIHQTYSQIQAGGIARKYIAATIGEGEGLGLIAVQHGMRKSRTQSHMSKFRLTYLPAKVVNPEYQGGKPYYVAPSDDWKRITEDRAKAIADRALRDRAAATGHRENVNCRPQREPVWFPNGNCTGSPTGTDAPESGGNAGVENAPLVPQREHPSISWGDAVNQVGAVCIADISAAHVDATTSTDLDQPTIRPAGRQSSHCRHSDGRDPRVWDIEDFLANKLEEQPALQTTPADKLRVGLKARLAASPRGTHKRLAGLVGVSSPHLSNFLAGNFGLNHGALARLQEWLDGKLILAPIAEAAA